MNTNASNITLSEDATTLMKWTARYAFERCNAKGCPNLWTHNGQCWTGNMPNWDFYRLMRAKNELIDAGLSTSDRFQVNLTTAGIQRVLRLI